MTVTDSENRRVERRLILIVAWLLSAGCIATWIVFDLVQATSFLCGGVLAVASMLWLRGGMNTVVLSDRKTSKRSVLAGFVLRLMLIPICLYAMIRFLFLGLAAAVAGFAVCHCSVLIEGILEAISSGSRNNARAE